MLDMSYGSHLSLAYTLQYKLPKLLCAMFWLVCKRYTNHLFYETHPFLFVFIVEDIW